MKGKLVMDFFLCEREVVLVAIVTNTDYSNNLFMF